jgi:hypothetical protein
MVSLAPGLVIRHHQVSISLLLAAWRDHPAVGRDQISAWLDPPPRVRDGTLDTRGTLVKAGTARAAARQSD